MSSARDIILPPHLQAAKAASRDLVRAFGGQEVAAEEAHRSQSRICAYGHANMADFMPVDVVDVLEERTQGLPGWPHVTRWLARRRGLLLVPRPVQSLAGAWGACLKRMTKEFGEVAQRIVDAVGDPDTPGEVTAAEIRATRLVEELDELAEQVARARAMAVHILERGE